MKIRYGLVLAMAIGLGLAGCASGGGSGGGCFIDTAAYEDEMIGDLLTLRKSTTGSIVLLLGVFLFIGLTREPKEH